MRRDRLCPGLDDCASAQIEQAQAREPEPARCAECPLEKLDAYLESRLGRAIQSVVDWDFALERRMSVALSDVTYQEFQLLRMLAEERNKWQAEEIERTRDRR